MPATLRETVLNSLRAQLYFGVVVIVILLVTIGLIGYFGTTSLARSSFAIRDVSDLNLAVLESDRDVQELQMWAEKYITTGHDSMRDSVLDVHEALTERVTETLNGQSSPEMRSSLEEISRHLEGYRAHFDSVVEERQLRTELAKSLLPKQSEAIANALGVMAEALQDSDKPTQLRVARLQCETLFYQAEQLLLRYFESPDSVVLNDALGKLKLATATVSKLAVDTETRQASQKLLSEFGGYRRITLRAVQATRGYLYLVNVVMAGEASEVSYYSERLRMLAESRRAEISVTSDATMERNRNVIVCSLIGAMTLALSMAGRLTVLILPPITSLTKTFRLLAAGETLVAIPEADRDDEIGEMAKAARVFSDQNRTTQKLLTQAEELGSQLQRKAEQLEASNSELDSFAYVASHDLKSPLRGIRQLATWIEEDSGHLLPGDSQLHLQQLTARVTKMETLLQDLLDYSRAGRQVREPEEIDLSALLQGIVDITDNPQGVKVTWPKDSLSLTTVRPQLEQVLLNLVGNAMKHNDKSADGLIDVKVAQEGDWYHFQVKDNGPGIDESNHDRVFQMYQRVGDVSVDGSGMGLAIVKKQVENAGGHVTLESCRGSGATFEFTWPVLVPSSHLEHCNA